MPHIRADLNACEGYGNCVQSAPSLFGMDDDDVVVVLQQQVERGDLGRAEEAALACPVRAIAIDRD